MTINHDTPEDLAPAGTEADDDPVFAPVAPTPAELLLARNNEMLAALLRVRAGFEKPHPLTRGEREAMAEGERLCRLVREQADFVL